MKQLGRAILMAAMLGLLALPAQVAAQRQMEGQPRFTLVDLGTFGGPASYVSNGLDGILNNQGTAVGWVDTSAPDPFPAFCFNFDCMVSHGFQWHKGVLTDLGTLPGGRSSQALWISANGLISGLAENGQIDPLLTGFAELRAVLWRNGEITNVGTLPGGYESVISAHNNRGQVVGFSTNGIPDPFSLWYAGFGLSSRTQTRAFLWQNGVMKDLGTLGGPDASASFVNEPGQVAGVAYTTSTPNPANGPSCLPNVPTQDPFLWERGKMADLGTLGGTCGTVSDLNNRGEVVGQSDLAGHSKYHPCLWTKSRGMQDLGTLGGDNGLTTWVNDAGAVVGDANLPGPLPQNHDAFLWRNGAMTDLGTLPGDSCSKAYSVNARGQVVGTSENRALWLVPTGEHAFLWQRGGSMIDLNTAIPAGSGLQLTFALAINDRGEIAGLGAPPGCALKDVETCGHAYILVPKGITESEGLTTKTYVNPAAVIQGPASVTNGHPAPDEMVAPFRTRPGHRRLAG